MSSSTPLETVEPLAFTVGEYLRMAMMITERLDLENLREATVGEYLRLWVDMLQLYQTNHNVKFADPCLDCLKSMLVRRHGLPDHAAHMEPASEPPQAPTTSSSSNHRQPLVANPPTPAFNEFDALATPSSVSSVLSGLSDDDSLVEYTDQAVGLEYVAQGVGEFSVDDPTDDDDDLSHVAERLGSLYTTPEHINVALPVVHVVSPTPAPTPASTPAPGTAPLAPAPGVQAGPMPGQWPNPIPPLLPPVRILTCVAPQQAAATTLHPAVTAQPIVAAQPAIVAQPAVVAQPIVAAQPAVAAANPIPAAPAAAAVLPPAIAHAAQLANISPLDIFVAPDSAATNWYVVTRGRRIGVFDNCAMMTHAIVHVKSGSGGGGYTNRAPALQAFEGFLSQGICYVAKP
ncbi:hypothetical protein C8Q80DRAFT_1269867 [Daedaleopsis nitida]|nr:hypothetical protein C8Q80DRAFT_1269867 [Daedaleopsis nitida]